MRDLIRQKVREAEELAAHSQNGSATQAAWMRLAESWRLMAERMIAERTGEDFPLHTLH